MGVGLELGPVQTESPEAFLILQLDNHIAVIKVRPIGFVEKGSWCLCVVREPRTLNQRA